MRSSVSARREGTSACGAVSLLAEKVPPHAEQGLRTPKRYLCMRRFFFARGERSPACRDGSPHAEKVPLHAEVLLRTRRTFARMQRWLSARGERTSACGAGSPHAEMGVVRELHLSASIGHSSGHGAYGSDPPPPPPLLFGCCWSLDNHLAVGVIHG